MTRCMTENHLLKFQEHLYEEEKSPATIQKYMRDLGKLKEYAGKQALTKKIIIAYKGQLKQSQKYQLSSINSFLAAANCFFDYMGWHDLKVRMFRIQKDAFIPENKNLTKEEYRRLVQTAKKKGRNRLALILETICATGIRIRKKTAGEYG